MCATDPIRDKEEMRRLADFYLEKNQIRNYAVIVVGFATALRIGDVLNLRWKDVYDFENERFYIHFNLTEQKTGKTKQVKINQMAKEALTKLIQERKQKGRLSKDSFVFSNDRKKENHISRVHVWRLIKKAVEELKIQGNIACHSLRKTFGYFAWKLEEKSQILIMEIYNHSSLNVTKRYLGITQDELDAVYDAMIL